MLSFSKGLLYWKQGESQDLTLVLTQLLGGIDGLDKGKGGEGVKKDMEKPVFCFERK